MPCTISSLSFLFFSLPSSLSPLFIFTLSSLASFLPFLPSSSLSLHLFTFCKTFHQHLLLVWTKTGFLITFCTCIYFDHLQSSLIFCSQLPLLAFFYLQGFLLISCIIYIFSFSLLLFLYYYFFIIFMHTYRYISTTLWIHLVFYLCF